MSADFLEKIALLVIGFLLTSVAGTLIAVGLQRRSWAHQWRIQRDEDRAAAARNVFDEVSRLMDRRLFAAAQLYLWCNRDDPERTAYALNAYRDALTEWNGSINRHLAMLQFYFGQQTREQFDMGVGRKFVDVGALIEDHYRLRKEGKSGDTPAIDRLLADLRGKVYDFNLAMLPKIERPSGV